MVYWIYTKKNETKPIVSRDFANVAEALKFAIRNGTNWKIGQMYRNDKIHGKFHKGKVRIGSNIPKSK